jgi:uncharacterized protein (DUF952 family)
MILHITSRPEWHAAQQRGDYRAPSLASEGFIHCSTAKQVLHVANAFYREKKDLVLLVIDETLVLPEVKWETPTGPPARGISQRDEFPHIYGPLNLEAVLQVVDFIPEADGSFQLPNLS